MVAVMVRAVVHSGGTLWWLVDMLALVCAQTCAHARVHRRLCVRVLVHACMRLFACVCACVREEGEDLRYL